MTDIGIHVLLLAMAAIMALAVIFGALARFYGFSSHCDSSSLESEQEILERSLAGREIDVDAYVGKRLVRPKSKRASRLT